MKTTAIVLAGGQSTRLGQDKGLQLVAGKPLVRHVLDAVRGITDEKLLVVSSQLQANSYTGNLTSDIRILVDHKETGSPLAGSLTGFREAAGDYSLLLACDAPLVSREIVTLLLELCPNKAATIPRWPNGYLEPLQAVYHTKSAFVAAETAIKKGHTRMQAMVDHLHGIRYVSTLVLQQLDPNLTTFLNINTQTDLKRAEGLLRKSGSKSF